MKAIVALLATASFIPQLAPAQETPAVIARYGGTQSPVLHDIRSVAVTSDSIVVVTGSEPVIHIFFDGGHNVFGREGGGPAEFAAPTAVAWAGQSVVVLDSEHRKLVSFSATGRFLRSRRIDAGWPRELAVVGADTLLGLAVPASPERTVVRLRGDGQDTVLAYSVNASKIRVAAPGAPSLTVYAPFAPRTVWAPVADSTIAVWEPGSDALRLLDARGLEVQRFPYTGRRWEVTGSDREAWFRAEFVTREFMGRRIFEPLLSRAEKTIEFPDHFPEVLAIRGDPSGRIWVRKTAAARGEVWVLVGDNGRVVGRLRLPPGRELLVAASGGLVAHASDRMAVEYVELYERPAWARP